MSLMAAIDLSTFIWDQAEYDDFSRRKDYYRLISIAQAIYRRVEAQKISILFRSQLLGLINGHFPYNMTGNIAKDIGIDFQELTFSFLTKVTWIPYDDNVNLISSNPVLHRTFFNTDINSEVQNKICYLYNNISSEHKYIVFCLFYDYQGNLELTNGKGTIEVDTLCYNSEEDVNHFFDRYRIKFVHNPKHDEYNSGGAVSPLSCYNERSGDTSKAQALLDSAFHFQGNYYNFDNEHRVYVKFAKTKGFEYHGYDITTSGIPHEVKKRFNK